MEQLTADDAYKLSLERKERIPDPPNYMIKEINDRIYVACSKGYVRTSISTIGGVIISLKLLDILRNQQSEVVLVKFIMN